LGGNWVREREITEKGKRKEYEDNGPDQAWRKIDAPDNIVQVAKTALLTFDQLDVAGFHDYDNLFHYLWQPSD